ncbi:hypothetical protein [Stutzerimonas kunmingensis]|uniref:hypothetical protein n=1 Tax=Stutzerimonas kunmingensis TaxID=1211807 RepID=UPI00241FFEA8|nr:hypothetical protein [Stutzerimonas kunmingensis]
MRWIGLVLGVGVLSGCMSTPKPMLASSEYTKVSGSWVAWNRCVAAGLVSPDIGALGLRYIQADLGNYQYDQATLDAAVHQASREMPQADSSFCNNAAALVAQRKQQIDINNAAVSKQEQVLQNTLNNIHKPVYCNTVGGVTMCN